MRYERLDELFARLATEDRELVRWLIDEGILEPRRTISDELVLSEEEADEVRVALVLARELGVNQEGIEVILPLRRRLAELRSDVLRLLDRGARRD